MNYYKRNLGDFARDTAHLSQCQIGAYNLMLDWYYANERPLPADKEDVQRIARAYSRDEIRAVEKVLADFFTLTDNGWEQKRADAELAKYAKQRDINRETGKKGGRPKKATEPEPNTEPKENRFGFDSVTEPEPNNNPNTESSNTEKARSKTLAQNAERAFDEKFWPAYPRKVGREAARKAFVRLKPDGSMLGVMLKSLAAQSASDQWRRDAQFIPHAATWINGKRWQDDMSGAGDDNGVPDFMARAI